MRDFRTVFSFELRHYIRSRVYLVITLLLILVSAVVFSWPNIVDTGTAPADAQEIYGTLLLRNESELDTQNLINSLHAGGYIAEPTDLSDEELRAGVDGESIDSVLFVRADLTAEHLVKSAALFDISSETFSALLTSAAQSDRMTRLGLTPDQVIEVQSTYIPTTVDATGKDQMNNFMLAYIICFLLYIAILLYGQLVSSSVASEKSNRSMELLITSTRTESLIFGKVLAASVAGFVQLFAIVGSMFVFYTLNAEVWSDSAFMTAAFSGSLPVMLWGLLFFVLGFFLYAFLYGACGSLVSRMEDLNNAVMPVTFLFVFAFMVPVMSLTTGNVNSPLMVVCSFIPFTAPLAMFGRIAIGEVQTVEILISLVLLLISIYGVGLFSSATYRLGVLMYGQPPKPKALLRALRRK